MLRCLIPRWKRFSIFMSIVTNSRSVSLINLYYKNENGTSFPFWNGKPLTQIVFSPTQEWGVLGKIYLLNLMVRNSDLSYF